MSPEAVANRKSSVILVVEDDPEILEMVELFLTDQGHTTLTASEGVAALAILESERAIDLLVTDLVMPGPVNGFELARRAVAAQPSLKVLYVSGFPDLIQQNEPLIARGEFLRKPFRLATLGDAIEKILAAAPVQLNRQLRRAHALWSTLRDGRGLPDIAQLGTLPPDLTANIGLVEAIAGEPDKFRYVRLGEALVRGFGEDPTGRLVGDKASERHRTFLIALHQEVVRIGRPLYAASSYVAAGAGTTTERLLLPFTRGGGDVEVILLAQTFDEIGERRGIFTLAPQAERRRDVVERL